MTRTVHSARVRRRPTARLALLSLIICLPPAARPQDVRYLRAQTWLTADGLPHDSVHQVLQTADGFIWAATEAGLARFDGVQFRTYTHLTHPAMLSDDLCCLAQTADGSLWAGSADGLLRLHQGTLERFGHEQGLGPAPSDRSPVLILGLAVDPAGDLIVLTPAGLSRGHDGRFEPVAGAPADVQAISPGRQHLWLLASGRLLAWPPSPSHPASMLIAQPAGIAEDPLGRAWVYSNTVVQAPAPAPASAATPATLPDQPRTWTVGADLPGTRITSLSIDREGKAWAGTNAGVVLLDAASGAAVPIPALPESDILQTFEDREGNTWCAGESSGLHLVRQLGFRNEAGLAGLGVTAVVQAGDGAAWAGTRRDGLRRVHAGTVAEPAPAASLTSPIILSLAPGLDGSVWAGTPDGLNHIGAAGAVRRLTSADGLPDDYIQALAAQPDGTLWAGTRHGLARLQGSRIQLLTAAEGLGSDLVGALLLARDGSLWIGTAAGVSHRTPGGMLTSYTARDGLGPGIVSALAQDAAGAVWIAGPNALLTRYAEGALHTLRLAGLTGQPAGPVIGLSARDGWLWLRSDRAISRVPLADLNACLPPNRPCQPRLTSYGAEDGVPSTETVAAGSPALSQMASGELWIASRRGVAIAAASPMPHNPLPPPVAIEQVLADDSVIGAGPDGIVLPYTRARLTIEYAGLSFTAPAQVRYRVMLQGFDRSWIAAGTRRSATYTNLPPGRYRFHVQASNNDGVWSPAGAELPLRIIPPYYRRWWFLLATAALLALLVLAAYRLRLRRLQVRFDAVLQERNRLAREIHDTLAQDFVGVTVQLDLVAQMLKTQRVESALAQVHDARALVTEGLAEARRSIWALRANAGEASLPGRLRALTQRLAQQPFSLRLNIGGAYRRLPPHIEDEVLRIAQEALANIGRHAAARTALVELTYASEMLVLCVEDDGRGFDATLVPEGHYGLQGMRERAATLGASLHIASRPGAGTRVRLEIAITAGLE